MPRLRDPHGFSTSGRGQLRHEAARETGLETELIKRDLGKLLLKLEELQEEKNKIDLEAEAYEMTAEEKEEALKFLRAADLVERIRKAFDDCGLVGEDTNKLVAYLSCCSRKLDHPLAVIIQSTSAAGKSTLMEAVLNMMPEEEKIKYSAMTGQSLYYLGETNLKHKILAIVEEEGAEKASYALKLLQSEGELTIASTGKDEQGRMKTEEYRVEGPVMIFLTTTAVEIDEELLNRCLILTVDESREQTRKIHELQRKSRTREGIIAKHKKKKIRALMKNVQRLIKPYDIYNPFADQLTFTSESTRTRRDHEKYLNLIDTITLLHQHQREITEIEIDGHKSEQITTTLEDIELANKLAPEVLGRSLDELPPQTRRIWGMIGDLVKQIAEGEEKKHCLFSRRQVREFSGWSEYQVRVHMQKLEDMEYIGRRSGRQGSLCLYQLLLDAENKTTACPIGLTDIKKLKKERGSATYGEQLRA